MYILAFVAMFSSELAFYLLIAQTGITEVFNSDFIILTPLAIGGIVGSLSIFYFKNLSLSIFARSSILFGIQIILSLNYPYYNMFELFIFGFSVGALAPLLVYQAKNVPFLFIAISLAISYTLGTYFFPTNPSDRVMIAIALSTIAFVASLFTSKLPLKSISTDVSWNEIFIFALWVFLDSALFETLARDEQNSIWSFGFSNEIIIFHLLGVLGALTISIEKHGAHLIWILFATSYFAYFNHDLLLLAAVYPFVISFYNVSIFKKLILIKSNQKIGLVMAIIGWGVSGIALETALNHWLFIGFLFIGILGIIAIKIEIPDYRILWHTFTSIQQKFKNARR